MRSGRNRVGFTLIELLVVIAIIGLLMALLLPALNMVRESARRAACQNNFKQFGLALRSYEVQWESFPPSRIRWKDRWGREILHSWTPFILSYLEQSKFGDLYNVDLHWKDPANTTLVKQGLQIFVCPSSPITFRYDRFTGAASADYGIINEVKLDFYDNTNTPKPFDRSGAMTRWNANKLKDVSDGIQHTILMAEDTGRPDVFIGSRQVPDVSAKDGNGWADPDMNFSVSGVQEDGMSEGGKCVLNCTNDSEVYSFHNGGSYFLFCDGSTRFISANIDYLTLIGLVTRAGGEMVRDGEP